jgi:hypothetical protein
MLDAVSCLRPLLPRSFLRLLANRAAPTTQAPPLVLVFIDATDSKRTDTWTSCAGTRVGCHIPYCHDANVSAGSIRFAQACTRHYFMSNLKSPLNVASCARGPATVAQRGSTWLGNSK